MIPIFRIYGYSNSGKTSAIEQMLPKLKLAGLKVAVVKHTHHLAAENESGKDTERFRAAGADYVELITMRSSRTIGEILADINGVDVILVEGFKEF
jgi:molybdopterin-guanine dinucleotide biosynthesis protein MobB